MISEITQQELKLVSMIITLNRMSPSIQQQYSDIIKSALKHAIADFDSVDEAIKYIVVNYSNTLPALREVVKKSYPDSPDSLEDLDKLAVLI